MGEEVGIEGVEEVDGRGGESEIMVGFKEEELIL
jgi:hypothetical protein